MKKVCIVSCPIATRSGYGARSRDFVRSLIDSKGEEWDIQLKATDNAEYVEDWIENNPERANLAELIVAKQRNGPTGVVKLHWDGEKTLFSSYSAAREPVGYNISSPNPSLIRMPQENELPPF
mgnify:CR=1 FL=1